MQPILAQIGPFTLYTYTILIDAGLVVALAALYWQAPAGHAWRWLDLGLAAVIGGFIGARLLYVALNADSTCRTSMKWCRCGRAAYPGWAHRLARCWAPGCMLGGTRRWGR